MVRAASRLCCSDESARTSGHTDIQQRRRARCTVLILETSPWTASATIGPFTYVRGGSLRRLGFYIHFIWAAIGISRFK